MTKNKNETQGICKLDLYICNKVAFVLKSKNAFQIRNLFIFNNEEKNSTY